MTLEEALRNRMTQVATSYNIDKTGTHNEDDAEYCAALLRELQNLGGAAGVPSDIRYAPDGQITNIKVGKSVTPVMMCNNNDNR
jgi:hypothetical protein